ncbi:cGMP-dependent protein kinase 1 [Homalodisca vitripennis]|nr:cGMP-dependent protein kinase 1 [Homalodisca vitripennis]KAG8312299.1 cGMP-dependent protein kinase 1 [Homalodisca vitripennis]
MSGTKELERRLAEREADITRRNDVISYLEKELDERDALIRHLRNEIDKFRQVVRPITQHMVSHLGLHGDNTESEEGWDPAQRLRTKRQAISAEPIIGDLKINKIPKTANVHIQRVIAGRNLHLRISTVYLQTRL